MVEAPIQRRLAAIFAADVVGYSRLMGQDEAGTLVAIQKLRTDVLDRAIVEHQGRLFKSMGDGFLADFPSVVNAVACAAAIQKVMAARNAALDDDRQLQLRIGIHLGDIISEGGDVYGEGVNIAARIEGMAPPGGVAVSAMVHDNIGNRLDLTFEDMGEQDLKNIAKPVRVYRLGTPLRSRSKYVESLKTKPSIAVLPFTNMSGDTEQEYFADGITEDLITDLSKVSGLLVIARNSVFTYKGKPVDVQEVGKRFNVTAVMEGSVRKANNRIRINAQLINVRDGTHLWADRYDSDLADIFALQDQITKTIIDQLKVKLLPQEMEAIETNPTQSVEAYNYYLRGRHLFHLFTTSHVLLAKRMFLKAVELDPAYARALAGLADVAFFLYLNDHEGVTVTEILDASTKALNIDPGISEAHASHGIGLHLMGRDAEAVAEFNRALAIDPDSFWGHWLYAHAARNKGDLETAAKMNRRACELNPDDSSVHFELSQIYLELGRIQESQEMARSGIRAAERIIALHPDLTLPLAVGAGALARLGERTRALDWCARALAIAPDDPLTLFNVACSYALLGEVDLTMDALERWRPRSNPKTRDWVRSDTDFDRLRGDPRFEAFLDSLA